MSRSWASRLTHLSGRSAVSSDEDNLLPGAELKSMTRKPKLVFILCSLVLVFTIWFSISSLPVPYNLSANSRFAHKEFRVKHRMLKPVLGGRHMIFIETSCVDKRFPTLVKKGFSLNPRQACSIESAARTNPDSKIYFLYTCPIADDIIEESTEFVKRVFNRPNVFVWKVNVEEYFLGTPLEEFYKTGKWRDTQWPKEHSSDILRFLTLWKFGGTYLDLDVIVRRSFADLGANFAGAESSNLLASCVLNFGAQGVGRDVSKRTLTELSSDFRGDEWGYNGPGVITRVMMKLCNVNETPAMYPARCNGFKIHNKDVFFPVFYDEWDLHFLFDEAHSEETMRRLQNSHAVHTWNKLSHDKPVTVGSRQPYGLLAQEFCPGVYYHCGPTF